MLVSVKVGVASHQYKLTQYQVLNHALISLYPLVQGPWCYYYLADQQAQQNAVSIIIKNMGVAAEPQYRAGFMFWSRVVEPALLQFLMTNGAQRKMTGCI